MKDARPGSERELQRLIADVRRRAEMPIEVLGAAPSAPSAGRVNAGLAITTACFNGVTLYEPTELAAARARARRSSGSRRGSPTRQMLAFELIDLGPVLGALPTAARSAPSSRRTSSGSRRVMFGA